MKDDIRLLNLLKRLRYLSEMENLYCIKAVAEEIDASVRKLLQREDGPGRT